MVSLSFANDRIRHHMSAAYVERNARVRGQSITAPVLPSLLLDTLTANNHFLISGRPFELEAWSGDMHQPLRTLRFTKISTGFNVEGFYRQLGPALVTQFDFAHRPSPLPLINPLHEDGNLSFHELTEAFAYGAGTVITRWRNRHIETLTGLLHDERTEAEWRAATAMSGIDECLFHLTNSVTTMTLERLLPPIHDDPITNRMAWAAWFITCRWASLQRERNANVLSLDGVRFAETETPPWPTMLQWGVLAHEDLLPLALHEAQPITSDPDWRPSEAMRRAAISTPAFGRVLERMRHSPASAVGFPHGRAPIIPVSNQRISGEQSHPVTPSPISSGRQRRLPSGRVAGPPVREPDLPDPWGLPGDTTEAVPVSTGDLPLAPETMSEAFDALRAKTPVARESLIRLFSITPESLRLLDEALDVEDRDARRAVERDMNEAMRRHLQRLTGLPVTVTPGDAADMDELVDAAMLALCARLLPRGAEKIGVRFSASSELISSMVYWRGPTRWLHGRELRKNVSDATLAMWFEEVTEIPSVYRRVRRAAKFKRWETLTPENKLLQGAIDVVMRIFDEHTKLGDTVAIQTLTRILEALKTDETNASPGVTHGRKRLWGSTPVGSDGVDDAEPGEVTEDSTSEDPNG